MNFESTPKRSSKVFPAVLAALAVLLLAGCRQDMHDQPRYKPLQESAFFSDGQAARPLVEGTVARGHLRLDTHYFEGKVNGQLATTFPFAITAEGMKRGQERYNIFCSPCHSHLGNGQGMIVQRGLRAPPSFHLDRLQQAPVGHFFDVISNGFGVMPSYASRIPVPDRWLIVAYVRALQLSQNATMTDVPEEDRQRLTGAQK